MNSNRTVSACALIAIAGSVCNAQSVDWLNAVDGDWNDGANWVGGMVPNSTTEVPVLGLSGMYTVTSTLNRTFGGLMITNPDAAFNWGTNSYNCYGDILNNGTININFNNSNFNSNLFFFADATMSGTGTIRLNATADTGDAGIIANAFNIVNANGHTIAGSGQLTSTITNSGDIIGDDPGSPGLRLNGSLTQTATGRVIADGGVVSLGNGTFTTGGEFATMNGGEINIPTNLATISDVNITGDVTINGGGNALAIDGDIENNGTIAINSNLNVFNARLLFNAESTINGTGVINMAMATTDQGDAQLNTNGEFPGTIGAGQTVQGSGVIDGRQKGTIVNNGMIIANDPDFALGISGSHSAGSGEYRAEGDGVLQLNNASVLDGLTFDTSGNGLVDVRGGLITASNITNNGQLGVEGNGRTLALIGPLTNNDSLNINSNANIFNAHVRFDANTIIDGTGTINMALGSTDLGDAQLHTAAGIIGTIGANQTIIGAGQIDGRNGGTIVLNGTAIGNDLVNVLALQGNIDASGGGIFRGDDGIVSLRGGLVLTGGTFETTGLGEVAKTNNGTATLSNVTNNGNLGIWGSGGLIDLAGDITNNGVLGINSNANIFNAHLVTNANVSILGNGTVRLQTAGDLADAQMDTADAVTLTIGPAQTVAGDGEIDGRSGGTIHNTGTINGDHSGAELRLSGTHTGTGTYRSDDGLLGLGGGLTMDGGTFDTSGTGEVAKANNGAATIMNMTNEGQLNIWGNGGFITLGSDLTNNGDIWINSNANIFNAHLRFDDNYAINGTGNIRMDTAGNVDDAQIIAAAGFTGTIGENQMLSGDGRLSGSFNINGTIDPDGLSRAFTADNITFSDDTHMIVDLGGDTAGSFDRIILGGPDVIELDGTLTVNLEAGYAPTFGDTWDIISGGSNTGIFDEVITGDAPIGQVYRVIYESNRVYVILTCDADLSGDGGIDFFDVSAFLSFFSAQDVRSDLNNDGVFNFFDVSVFLQLFGQGCNP